ncbi:MAG: LCP family protein [Ardenticatenaceae bacterium]
MNRLSSSITEWLGGLYAAFARFSMAPRPILWGYAMGGLSLALALMLAGAMLYQPESFVMAAPLASSSSPLIPPDFTPVVSPPRAFGEQLEAGVTPLPSVISTASAGQQAQLANSIPVEDAAVPSGQPPGPTATPVPVDEIFRQRARGNEIEEQRRVSVLLMGTDARPTEGIASRTDTLMVAILNLDDASVTLISIPRDLWVAIPGYGEARINTAYFLGQLRHDGAEVARRTVSHVLGIPINHTMTIDFAGFEDLIDVIGGIDLEVPTAIDDWAYPDDTYGTFRLVIPDGFQHMDGEITLQYARTRHGSSDFERAKRQQAILRAIRRELLRPDQLPHLPGYLMQGASEVNTTFSLADLFFLARFLRTLDDERIFMHVIEAPLLWNGVTGDGQQVLLYDPYTLQQAVQQWLWEASGENMSRR